MMKMMKKSCGAVLMSAFLLLGLGLFTNIANAASYTVSNISNSGAGSLRDAINSANADGVDSDITFDGNFFSTLKTVALSSELGLANNGALSITGPAAGVEISGNSAVRVFSVASGANVTLTGLNIIRGKSDASGGGAYDAGGGIYNSGTLKVDRCLLQSNTSTGRGGGIANVGDLTVTDSTISGNTARAQGGGIDNGDPFGINSAPLTMTGCTLRGNRAGDGSSVDKYHGNGGALYAGYASTATVTNCTFITNLSDNPGGAVYATGGALLTNCTFVSNTNLLVTPNAQEGGGVYGGYSSYVALTNCLGVGNMPDNFGGKINDGGGNVQASTLQEAGLDPNGAQNNGGPTQTYALVSKGTAVNAGVAVNNGPIFDQRGAYYLRYIGGRIDSGAYESSFAVTLISSEGLTVPVGGTATITQAMLYATDSAGDPVSYTITSGPIHGSVTLNGNPTSSFTQADIAAGNVAYTEDGTFADYDDIGFYATDGKGAVAPGNFRITITETASLVVTTTADTVSTDGLTSLREAIAYANTNADLSAITFNIPPVQQTSGVWIISTGSPLVINETATITGPGANLLTVKEGNANKSYGVIQAYKGITLSGVTLSNGGAGFDNKSTAISTLSNCVLTGNGYGFYNDGMATISNCTLSSNTTNGFINNSSQSSATVTNCILNNNAYGILNFGSATVTTVTNCTIDGNTANGFQNGGNATVTNCTISGGGSSGSYGFLNIGGGTATTLTNCTISGNTYGILGNSGSITVTNCTVTGNSNTGFLNLSTATLNNSLVVGNTTNLGGGTAPGGSNNITTGTAAAAGLDPAGLQNNGGPTKTIALVSGSAAIDAANDANAPATDQRGIARPQGAHSDIGAFEVAPSLSINDVTVTEGQSGTVSANFVVTLSAAGTQTVTAAYGAISGTTNPATVSSDFLSTKGTLTFAPGQTTKTITVPVVGDYMPEANETFIVKLSGPVNATISDGQGLGTITNDDSDTTPPTVSFTTSTTTPKGTTPQTGGTVYNVIPAITGVAADAGSGIARVQLRLYRATATAGVYEYWNGTGWVVPGGSVAIPMLITVLSPGAGSANVTWVRSTAWPTGSNFADGTYYLTAYAFDRAGKFASSARNFKKSSDSTGPSVSFTTSATTPVGTTPVSGGTVSGTIPTITGIAADSASGVAKIELRLYRPTATAGVYENWNGTAWTTTLAALSTVMNPAAGGANVSWSRSSGWPAAGDFANGTYYLRATAYDKAGNLTATLASNFKKVTSAGQALQLFEDEPSQ